MAWWNPGDWFSSETTAQTGTEPSTWEAYSPPSQSAPSTSSSGWDWGSIFKGAVGVAGLGVTLWQQHEASERLADERKNMALLRSSSVGPTPGMTGGPVFIPTGSGGTTVLGGGGGGGGFALSPMMLAALGGVLLIVMMLGQRR
jgi:hypothetical protein